MSGTKNAIKEKRNVLEAFINTLEIGEQRIHKLEDTSIETFKN